MKHTLKKLISVVLCAVMVCSAPLSSVAATINVSPVIYIGEMTDNALYSNANKINSAVVFDANSSDFLGDIASIVAPVLLAAEVGTQGAVTGVANGIKAIMDPILCGPDGTSSNASVGAWKYTDPISKHKTDEVYTTNKNLQAFEKAANAYVNSDEIFFFGYDWRLDPVAAAEELCGFIDHVESMTGKNTVAIVAVGYGGVVANSYMYTYQDHFIENVTSVTFYNCPILGNAVIGDFMKGKITRTYEDDGSLMGAINTISGAHRGEAFMNFLEDDVTGTFDGIIENLLGSSDLSKLFGNLFMLLVSAIVSGQDFHKDFGKSYNSFAIDADGILYDSFLRDYLRNMPGLWALVPVEDYDDAVEFMFGDDFINPDLHRKMESYRSVINNTAMTLKLAQLNGINVSVVANYGYQIIPVTASLDDVSDGIESVKYASAGAVTTDNNTGEGKYKVCIGEHKHVAPDNDIDASYCALPENTWFIKDVAHGDLTKGTVADFVASLAFSFEQRTIWDDAKYPQYLAYSEYSKKLTPYITPGEEVPGSKYGDVNLDGQVTAADARLVLRYSVNLDVPTKTGKIIADVDADSRIAAADARLVLRYSVGLIHSFPVEY